MSELHSDVDSWELLATVVSENSGEMLPEMTGRIRHFLFAYRPELRDELTAEAVALAWQAFRSARTRDKDVQPSTLAWYCARAVRSGRKLAGSSTTDATSMQAQKEQGRAKSLDIDPTIVRGR